MKRYFQAKVYVCLDSENALNEEGEPTSEEPTLEQVKNAMAAAHIIDFDMEENGNPLGWGATDIDWESLREIDEGQASSRAADPVYVVIRQESDRREYDTAVVVGIFRSRAAAEQKMADDITDSGYDVADYDIITSIVEG